MDKRPKVHFLRTLLVALVGLALCLAYLILSLGTYDSADEASYHQLVSSASQGNSNTSSTATQERRGVCKDILFSDQGKRLRMRLRSEKADMALHRRDDCTEVVEHMSNVVCYLQEDLLQEKGMQPTQAVLFLEAEKASYNYKSDLFTAEKANVSRYLAEGHSPDESKLPLKVLANGTADRLEFSLTGKRAHFKADGQVIVEHALGKVSAGHMITESVEDEKPFVLLSMNDHVCFEYKNGGTLSCDRAKLDYEKLSGTFFGSDNDGDVVFSENNRGIVVSSRNMQASLTKKNMIDNIVANDHVKVSFNRNFVANADHATFQRKEGVTSEHALPGKIVMSRAGPEKLCEITTQAGDLVRSVKIEIDTIERLLTLTYPRGTLKAGREGDIDVSADRLTWDDQKGILTLRHAIEINQACLGKLEAVDEVRLIQQSIDGHMVFSIIEAQGDTVLTYQDEDKNLSHTLTCHGPIKIDHQRKETRISSPREADGTVLEANQICFKDAKGEIFADKVLIKYDYPQRKLVPIQLIPAGNVKIFNRLPSSESDEAIVKQYVLADRVDFFPQQKAMRLKAGPHQRVLLYDKENSLEVSAPALKIIRDKASKKESIQGMGDVRFSFVESEFEQLRRKFSLDRSADSTATEKSYE